jgi:SAM-dependent methyltransferase
VIGAPRGTSPRYPIPAAPGAVDRAIVRTGTIAPMRCPVCGRLSVATGFSDNLRETGRCRRCGATNRNRQVAFVAARAVAELRGRPVRTLADVRALPDLVVYNTEAQGSLHDQLHPMRGYLCSEYLGPDHEPGEVVGHTTHQDLMALSYADESIDLVLSSDVFEHVPDPYRAHAEVRRVLRPRGHHVFTVPFHQHAHLDDVRARLGDSGEVELLADAIYHDDPVRPEGVLVFTIFGLEMLVRLAELGFDTKMYCLWSPWHGIVGPNALVFDAVRQP